MCVWTTPLNDTCSILLFVVQKHSVISVTPIVFVQKPNGNSIQTDPPLVVRMNLGFRTPLLVIRKAASDITLAVEFVIVKAL